MGDIGHHRHVELAGRHTPLRQPVRSGLQDNVGQASPHHLSQVSLHARRLRGGDVETGIEDLLADQRIDG